MNDPNQDCPFCTIARGEDPSVEIVCESNEPLNADVEREGSESNEWVAFFPPEPATPATCCGQGAWLWFRVRNFHDRAPTLGVDYDSFTDSWAKHELKHAFVRLERQGFQKWDQGTYRYEANRHDLAAARADGFREAFAEQVTALVGAGAFELDLRRMS